MFTRNELLDRGVGSVSEVISFHSQSLSDNPSDNSWGMELGQAVRHMPDNDRCRHVLMALVCAMANRGIESTNRLFSLDDKGNIKSEYIATGAEASIVASLVLAD